VGVAGLVARPDVSLGGSEPCGHPLSEQLVLGVGWMGMRYAPPIDRGLQALRTSLKPILAISATMPLNGDAGLQRVTVKWVVSG